MYLETFNIWNMYTVRWSKIIVLLTMVGLLAVPVSLKAQFNAHSFDSKYLTRPLHFGILMGINKSSFRVRHSDIFTNNDSISLAEGIKGPGFNLGIVSNLRISRHFDLRFLPTMVFAERRLYYETFQDTNFTQSIESINVEVPLLLKFKSEPYKDMRMYVLCGLKYAYDLASNAKARNAENLVKIGRHDIQIEYGIGMEIYFPYFILAPEIRISQGLLDIHSLDSHLQFSNVFQKLLSRSIVFTLNFEG